MTTTENTATASQSAAVIDAPNKATKAPEKQAEQVEQKTVKANHKAISAKLETPQERVAVTVEILKNQVDLTNLEKSVQDAYSDAVRVAKIASDNGYGREVKSVAGTALKIVNLPAVREMAKSGLLGDKDRTKSRVDSVVALNQLIDSLQFFGLMRRTVEK